MPNSTTQRWCAWSGIATIVLFFTGFIISQLFPPPGPSLTQSEVVEIYQHNANYIRTGMLILMVSGMFISPFIALISLHLKRIEGGSNLMANTQLSAGTSGIMFFILPAVAFLLTAFRPERPPEVTYMMNDVSWFLLVLPWPTFFMQNVSIGIAVLQDKSANPIFPRWLGFFNFWMAVGLIPTSLMVFFKSGPFAWNGIFPFWLPASLFGIWFIVMLVMLLKAIRRQEQEILV